jgi:hypothetical protein
MIWTQLGEFYPVAMFPDSLLSSVSENIAVDLESFSNHAGRTNVSTDDVLLLARRNEDLYTMIKDVVDRQKAEKGKKRKR